MKRESHWMNFVGNDQKTSLISKWDEGKKSNDKQNKKTWNFWVDEKVGSSEKDKLEQIQTRQQVCVCGGG